MTTLKFSGLSQAFAKHFQKMTETGLFRVNIDGDSLWDTYLKSFPAGTDPLFRKRTEHDCSTCRGFIKRVGSLVTISKDYELVSVWDFAVDSTDQG